MMLTVGDFDDEMVIRILMILTTRMVVIMALMMMLTDDARSAFESTALSPFSISCLTAKLARLEVN